ncbi:MBL fold metallo-hydrolase [Methyloraptor flagellatus]|uniref:MBL fold metallo-hydrolase n=1 Tax=Methyloraptor flagellatus TaxID=3162530 RepID=A0AAU7X7E2_9HYPH
MSDHPRRFGSYDVTRICDGGIDLPVGALLHTGGEAATAAAIAAHGAPTLRLDVNFYLLRGPSGVILVDAGGGPAFAAGLGLGLPALAAQGIAPADVPTVLLTHLHGDHAYGLLDGDAALFPDAEIVVPARELAYFTDAAAREATPEARRGGFRVAERLLRAYGSQVTTGEEGEILPEIETVALPGHTPGQTGFLIGSGAERLLILGDTLHLDGPQAADPALGFVFDVDPAVAAATRVATLDRAATEGWTIAGGHLGFGRVARSGSAFRIDPA